jgi:exportin-2 (importin alpha re-exporter)
LQALKKLFKKYRYSFATKDLVDEMLFVIPLTGPAILAIMKNYTDFLTASLASKDTQGANTALSLICLILHIFYSLNSVELPEFFEDSMNSWMFYFKSLLDLKDKSETVISCKTHVIKNITLYCEKYVADFQSYICPFFSLIWEQIEQSTMQSDYDKVTFFYVKLNSLYQVF